MKRKDQSETSEDEGSESEGPTPAKPELKKDTPVTNKSTKPPPPPSTSDEEEEEEEEEESDSTTNGAAAKKPPPTPKGVAAAKRARDGKADSQQEAKKMKTDEQPAKATFKKKEDKEKGENKAAEVGEKNNNTKQNNKTEQPAEKETKDPAKYNFKRTWSAKDEAALTQQLLEDLKAGVDFRTKAKSDSYWTELLETLKPKLDGEYTKDQVFDKHRRIRSKYEKSGGSRSRKRNPSDEALHNLMKQIWGPEAVRPTPANSKGTAMKAAMSDDEESNGEMDTSALEPKKLEHIMNDAAKAGDGGSRHKSPMSSFVASVCSEMVNGYKLGSATAAAAGMTGKLRTHILEVMEAECDVMSRRLQVASEIYTQEMELIKKLRSTRSH